MSSINAYHPDYAIHPGEYLEEIIYSRELKKTDLAKRSGLSEKQISQIIGKHANISPNTALALEKAIGVSATIWNNLNAQFMLYQAKEEEKKLNLTNEQWLKQFPISEMKKKGILSLTQDVPTLIRELLTFFQVSSVEIWEKYFHTKTVNYRKSKAFSTDFYSTMAWLKLGELQAEKIETKPFNKKKFKQNLGKIRQLTKEKPAIFEPAMIDLCATSGVALAFVPEFKKTHLSGATQWLTKDKAVIILSLRHRSDDHFWFSFFHEAGHILLHGKKNLFIDYTGKTDTEIEREADDFACCLLVPKKDYDYFVKTNKPIFYKATVVDFAKTQGIAPGIIVGMLQHDHLLKYTFLNELKRKFIFTSEAE